jgi:hypothetical protein
MRRGCGINPTREQPIRGVERALRLAPVRDHSQSDNEAEKTDQLREKNRERGLLPVVVIVVGWLSLIKGLAALAVAPKVVHKIIFFVSQCFINLRNFQTLPCALNRPQCLVRRTMVDAVNALIRRHREPFHANTVLLHTVV